LPVGSYIVTASYHQRQIQTNLIVMENQTNERMPKIPIILHNAVPKCFAVLTFCCPAKLAEPI
jgi:hypothetical protein